VPVLTNPRWEIYAQGLAQGKTSDDAYSSAGYNPNRKNATRLKTNQDVITRVVELQGSRTDRLVISRQYVIDALIENAEKALGRRPVKIGSNGHAKETYVYRGEVANQAIRLAGIEVGMFVERKEVKHISELASLSDVELLEELVRSAGEAQELLEYHGDEAADEAETSE
jgi:hypothetical protein